jgi:hypothetical protein
VGYSGAPSPLSSSPFLDAPSLCPSCLSLQEALTATEETLVTTLSDLITKSYFAFAEKIKMNSKSNEKNVFQESYDLIEELLINAIPPHLRLRIEDKILEILQSLEAEKGKESERDGDEMIPNLIDSMKRRLNDKESHRRSSLFKDVLLADESDLENELYSSKGARFFYNLKLVIFELFD